MRGKALVDDGKGSVEVGVGLLDVGAKCVVVDCRAIGECYDLLVDGNHATPQFECIEVFKCYVHCTLFGGQLLLVLLGIRFVAIVAVLFAPLFSSRLHSSKRSAVSSVYR